MANRVDPDQMQHSVPSDRGLQYLPRQWPVQILGQVRSLGVSILRVQLNTLNIETP